MNVKVCLDKVGFSIKPDRNETVKLTGRIAGYEQELEIQELAEATGNLGYSFCPATFTGDNRRASDFQQMQVFGLDFDGGYTYKEILAQLQAYRLPVTFSYHTFSSSTEYPRFRIVLCHIVPVREKWIADMILQMLKIMFPNADASCFEVARVFFGGKEIIELNEDAVFRLDDLSYMFQQNLMMTDKHNYSRSIKRFADRFDIALNNKKFLCIDAYRDGESEEILGTCNIHIIELPHISSKIVIHKGGRASSYTQTPNNMRRFPSVEKISIASLRKKCRLSGEFIDGTYLSHQERFLLATNFKNIRGLKHIFLRVIEDYYDSIEKWKFAWDYIQSMDYRPMSCDGNCPYAQQCLHDKNLCLTLKGRKKITKLPETRNFVTVNESYDYMEAALRKAVISKDCTIHEIKGQTGLGKSSAYKKLMRETDALLIIAVPTVHLKHEIAASCSDCAIEAVSLKDLYLPLEISERIAALFDRGLYKEAKKEVCDYAKELDDDFRKEKCERYISFEKIMQERDKHIIMTHAQLLNMSQKQLAGYTIIVDEDILMTILKNTKSVAVHEVMTAIDRGLLSDKKAGEIQQLLLAGDGAYLKSDCTDGHFYTKKETLDDYGITGNINELYSAGSYHLNGDIIEYYVPLKLPEQKIIIMSATLDEAVYRLFFNRRFCKVYDTPEALYKGKVIQYSHYSMSRVNLSHLAEVHGGKKALFEKIGQIASDAEYGISFKEYDDFLHGELHFGNAAGTDRWKGRNGMVIGTPHLNESSYKLIGCFLGLPVSGKSAELSRQRIHYKGYEFYMMTYSDKNMREIQLYMIGSEMEQCIGRSRLLRENAVVYVFSNFPCVQAEIIQTDYLEDEKNVKENRCTGQGASAEIG